MYRFIKEIISFFNSYFISKILIGFVQTFKVKEKNVCQNTFSRYVRQQIWTH